MPEPQTVTVESTTTQGNMNYKIESDKYIEEYCNNDDGDDNDNDNIKGNGYKHYISKEVQSNIENVQREANILVDNVLEESIHIVNEHQDRNPIKPCCAAVDSRSKTEHSTESENNAITCDDIGLDVIKSPTIESMSGKSFDDNISFTEERVVTVTAAATISTTQDDGKEKCKREHTTTPTSVAKEFNN